ncbi:MAG: tetratricopeptide repeat protein [Nitrospinaceae bacterium]|nr:tetratricopeptide repeat protein [Nitrospinaceae bacterium]NIR55448.1 tetratricopeptide repeat protein [Nitrospinaceae bacterium]NIS85888.1 tetratricopeptide repeat protein [Nitrospinaceae bacterium]NIT82732.1 tetratricopeptide repeat protein [Nitrospinaceae bacterium]NIU44941.1 tetratricopeptide repeat protein [Nitrospinaceae bacterium]
MPTLLILCLTGGVWAGGSPAAAQDAEGWFIEGNRLSAQGRFEDAVEAYQRSIRLNPRSPAAYYNLGIAYKNLEAYEQAVQAFENTLELEPFNLDARVSLGNIYNLQEKWEKAIGQLNIVVHRRRNDAQAHGNLGWAYYNYPGKPSFEFLTILNLRKAVDLFEAQGQNQAAESTRKVLEEALRKFGRQGKN